MANALLRYIIGDRLRGREIVVAAKRQGTKKLALCIILLAALASVLAGCSGSKRLTDLETKTAANTTALAELVGKVDSFPTLLAANGSQIADLKKVVDSYAPLISGNGSRITDLERQIATYPSMIASNASEIAAVTKRIEGYPGLIDENSKEIASLRRDLDSYSNQATSAANQLAELKKQVDGQSSTILGNLTLIANNSTQLSQLQHEVETLPAAVDAQGAKVAELAAQIAGLSAAIEGSATRIAKLEDEIASYEAQANADRASLARVRDEVQTNSLRMEAATSAVSAAEALVQSHSLAIASLEARVDDVQSRAAGLSTVFKVGYLDSEAALTALTGVAGGLEQTQAVKEAALVTLGEQLDAGAITGQVYAQSASRLRVEVLVLRVEVDLALVGTWAASPAFGDASADLEVLKGDGEKLDGELASLLRAVGQGGVDQSQFVAQYAALETRQVALDSRVREIGRTRVLAAAEEVAKAKGYDLILRSEDVLVNGNTDRLPDITSLVKDRLLASLK